AFLSGRTWEGAAPMSQTSSGRTICCVAAALSFAASAMAQQVDQRNRSPRRPEGESPRSVSPAHQHLSGVIIKSEGIRKDTGTQPERGSEAKGRSTPIRLTINAAAVWRDWYRDQVGQSAGAPPLAEAERGANSVATKGEPRSEDTEVVIIV